MSAGGKLTPGIVEMAHGAAEDCRDVGIHRPQQGEELMTDAVAPVTDIGIAAVGDVGFAPLFQQFEQRLPRCLQQRTYNAFVVHHAHAGKSA